MKRLGESPRPSSPTLRRWLLMQLLPDLVPPDRIKSLIVESGALCQLRCPLCPTGTGELRLSREFLAPERLRTLLDSVPSSIQSVGLIHWGEPLLNPWIADLIREAGSRGLETSITTTLSIPAFDDEAAKRLIRSGLTHMFVSCDGVSQERYETYRAGGRLSVVLRNLELMARAKRSLRAANPRITWKFLIHDGNRQERDDAAKIARRMGIRFVSKPLLGTLALTTDETGRPARAAEPAADAKDALSPAIAAREPEASASDHEPAAAPRTTTYDGKPDGDDYGDPCLQPWRMPIIHSDGTVLPCCAVRDARHGWGNLLKETFESIWNKPVAVALRRYLRSGIRSEFDLPCYDCAFNPNRPNPRT